MTGGDPTARVLRSVRAHPVVVDGAVAGLALATIVVNVSAHAGSHGGRAETVHQLPGLGFAVVAFAALLARRRWPLPAATVAVAATAASLVGARHYWWIAPAPAIALFHLASLPHPRVRLPVVVVAVGIAVVGVPWASAPGEWWGAGGSHESSVAVFAACAVALAAGDASRHRRAHLAATEQRAEQAELERDLEARRRVTQERLRIARDLHDSIGHHLAIINAQAGMAEKVPTTTAEALGHIKAESRAALDNLRDTVGLLRQPDEPTAPTEPLAGLHQLDELLDRFRRSGMTIEADVATTHPVPLPADVAAYRIVQESLTNAAKHSPGSEVRLRIELRADSLLVLVQNDASQRSAHVNGAPGHGIAGMCERANAIGGTLEAARTASGFRVAAELPIGTGRTP